MINRATQQTTTQSFLPKYCDTDILKSLVNSDVWQHIFLGNKQGVWLITKGLFFLKLEMFALPIRNFLRFNHGSRTIGITIIVLSTLMMIAFNTQYMVGYVATFFPFAAPIIPFFMTSDDMIIATFFAVKSNLLLKFWIGFLIVSIIHLIRIYVGWGNFDSPTKRGRSILHTLIFRHIRISEKMVKQFIEPLLVSSIGYYCLSAGVDYTLGLFLMIAAFCLFFQENYEALLNFAMKPS